MYRGEQQKKLSRDKVTPMEVESGLLLRYPKILQHKEKTLTAIFKNETLSASKF